MRGLGVLVAIVLLGVSGCLTKPIPSGRFADASWYEAGSFEPPLDSHANKTFSFHADPVRHMRVAMEWSARESRFLGSFRLERPDGTDVITETFNKGAKVEDSWYEQDAPMFGDWTMTLWAGARVDYAIGVYF